MASGLAIRMYSSDIVNHPLQALSKNGKVYGNGIMVGVQQCIDKVSPLPHPSHVHMTLYAPVT